MLRPLTAIALASRLFPINAKDVGANLVIEAGPSIAQSTWQAQPWEDGMAALEPAACNSSMLTHDFSTSYYRNVVGSHDRVKVNALRAKYSYGLVRELASGSGAGSDLGPATSASLSLLKRTIPRLGIRTLIDTPCGDVTWQFHSWEMDSLAEYVGVDVVRAVILMNAMRFAHHSNKHFAHWDFVGCGIPRLRTRRGAVRPFDMVHMRDVLMHLSIRSGVRAIQNVCLSGAHYLMATTYNRTLTRAGRKAPLQPTSSVPVLVNTRGSHPDDGGWYPNNLALPPFNLPQPIDCVQTHPHHEPDFTCVYDVRHFPGCTPPEGSAR